MKDPSKAEVIKEAPLHLRVLHVLQEGEHIVPVHLDLQVAPDQGPQPHPDVPVALVVGLGGGLEVGAPDVGEAEPHTNSLRARISRILPNNFSAFLAMLRSVPLTSVSDAVAGVPLILSESVKNLLRSI